MDDSVTVNDLSNLIMLLVLPMLDGRIFVNYYVRLFPNDPNLNLLPGFDSELKPMNEVTQILKDNRNSIHRYLSTMRNSIMMLDFLDTLEWNTPNVVQKEGKVIRPTYWNEDMHQ